jgi:hypothetical protein
MGIVDDAVNVAVTNLFHHLTLFQFVPLQKVRVVFVKITKLIAERLMEEGPRDDLSGQQVEGARNLILIQVADNVVLQDAEGGYL